MITCSDALRTVVSATSDVVGACLQAEAAIRAAKIQARATTNAGWLTAIAGVTALVAAIVAYLAAGRQVQLAERQHDAKRMVYGGLIYKSLGDLKEDVEFLSDTIPSYLDFLQEQPTISFYSPLTAGSAASFGPVAIPNLLSDSLWRDHAILGPDAATAIVSTYRHAESLNKDIGHFRSWIEGIDKEISQIKKTHSPPETHIPEEYKIREDIQNFLNRSTYDKMLPTNEEMTRKGAKELLDSINSSLNTLKDYGTRSPSA